MPDLVAKNIEQIKNLFPFVITETKDKDGNIKQAVDFDLLRQSLSDVLVEDDNERYRLDWPGKKASLLKANTTINKTLRPVPAESVDFENTQNLFIEGDNFEVLKILQESYLGNIKMIYIDPPYNTGSDFIYKDNFTVSKDEYSDEIGAIDEEGGKLFKNTDSNGRFHSDWLSMMYERLVLARDLLKEDGVIFISINDNELANLFSICQEIFGAENCITNFIRKTKSTTNDAGEGINIQHEYCLVVSKAVNSVYLRGEYKTYESYSNPDNDPRGAWTSSDPTATDDGRKTKNLMEIINPYTNKIDTPGIGRRWRFNVDGYKQLIDDKRIIFKQKHADNERGFILKRYKAELKDDRHLVPSLLIENKYLNQAASKELNDLMDGKLLDYPKPVSFISDLIKYTTYDNDFILDFFSGSATTAHAVIQVNAEDGGKRKFIMVQLPEKTGEDSEAYKAGYKTIAEIGKERIRRAGKKIKEEQQVKNKQLELGESSIDVSKLDIGFRVYKTDSSNMKDVFYHPTELKQEQLSILASNIKEDRTPEDILTQVILDLGLELSLPIEKKIIFDNNIFIVQQNALVACFDDDINFKIVDEIAELKPFKVVFKDASFKDDKDKINVEERFKRLSPETAITVL